MSKRTHRVLLPFAVSLSIAGFFGCAQSTSFAQDSSHAQQAGGDSRNLVNPELCEDDNEAGRIRADGQNAVSRRGKVLTITTSGKPVKFVDNKDDGERSSSYVFCQFVPEIPGYLIKGYGYEWQWYILVSDSGSKIDMPGPPAPSPSRRYVAASNWSEGSFSNNQIELWEIVRSSRTASFKKVWGMNLDEGGQSAKWGPGQVYWLNETTFEFPQLSTTDAGGIPESQQIRWMRVALRGNQWQPVTATTPLTAQPATVSTAAAPPATASNTHSSAPARQRLTPEERVTCRAQAQQGRNREERRQLFRECRQGMLSASMSPITPAPESSMANPAAVVQATPKRNAATDAQIIAEATGGELKATKGKYYAKDCERWIEYEAKVVDLNNDGQPEVFTQEYGGICFGMTGIYMDLFIRDQAGKWQPQFGFPGIYEVLKTKNQGYPDIEIGGRGDCFPVWRWNGQKYDIYKQCP